MPRSPRPCRAARAPRVKKTDLAAGPTAAAPPEPRTGLKREWLHSETAVPAGAATHHVQCATPAGALTLELRSSGPSA